MSEKQEILDAAADGDVKAFFSALYRRNFCACDNYEEEITLAEALEALGEEEEHDVIRAQLKRLNEWMVPLWTGPALCYWQGVDPGLPDSQFEETVELCFHRYRHFADQ